MGLLDDYTNGIGMPRPTRQHQRVMSRLHVNLCNELCSKGFESLTETTVTNDLNDLAPDIIVFDEDNTPILVIEITTHRECKKIIKKCDELISRFPNTEYFVYDYETDIWYAYDQEADEWYSSNEDEICSSYLKYPLPNYLI